MALCKTLLEICERKCPELSADFMAPFGAVEFCRENVSACEKTPKASSGEGGQGWKG